VADRQENRIKRAMQKHKMNLGFKRENEYDVHDKKQSEADPFSSTAAQAEATHFAIFRNAADEVKFIQLNPVSMRLLNLLQTTRLSGETALRQIAAELQHPNPEAVLAGGHQIMQTLLESGAMLGVWRPESAAANHPAL